MDPIFSQLLCLLITMEWRAARLASSLLFQIIILILWFFQYKIPILPYFYDEKNKMANKATRGKVFFSI